MTVAEELAKLHAARGREAEIADAELDMSGGADEGVTWRLSEAAKAAEKAFRSGQEDKEEYETSENGMRIKRDEKNALDALVNAINKQKPHG